MDRNQLNRLLQTIGKICFENCYEIACKKCDNLTIDDLVKHDPELKKKKESGLRTRLSSIKRIVSAGCAHEALHIAKNMRIR